MDLNRVAAFARVVHDGSFTAAARALGVPKSSVSRSVAQLEEDLGTRLLHRTTRKIHLTEAGSAFYDRVAHALAEIDEATAETSATQAQPRGIVRVTAPPDIGVAAIASIAARCSRQNPTIRIDVSIANRVVDLVAEGVDLAVRAGQIQDPSLVARRVGVIEVGLYASARYVARRGAPSSLDDLAQHEAVGFRSVFGKSVWSLRSTDGRTADVDVEAKIGADDMMFVKRAVLAGAGIGLVPTLLCRREIERGRLVRVLPEWSAARTDVSVVYPSARFLPRRVAIVRDVLVSGLKAFLERCNLQKDGAATREKNVQDASAARSQTQ